MRMQEERLEKIKEAKVTAVIRTETMETGEKTSDACLQGGISSIEVTWTTPEAGELVKKLNEKKTDKVIIGAGSILDGEMAKEAVESGAEYIVGPNFSREVCDIAMKQEIPYLPGCMTINEMLVAEKYGASIIKLFPGNHFGPSFVKAVKAPIPHLSIMPTGGVSLENIEDWFEAGVTAVGIGGEINRAGEQQDYEKVKQLAEAYMEAAEKK
ncbi:bifunctional 2-keto-4-hydroxyglutarate aldolase/2-keto-3-deoxy-6-phosphogluconate aldolase [Alkalicoccus saliphilus]|nr:bifunctional 2-keto-4-hydroxyglutarate aldolase/2-keto-3-deoxy-6-phosphogluconate aldolase [Alkalicoccus saliphilus]